MNISQVIELFRSLTKEYFAEATVAFSNQSRTPKTGLPLVILSFGNISRPTFANNVVIDGQNIGHYETSIPITIDLFTHGAPLFEDGKIFAHEDTALDDMMSFADYLDSQYALDWCHIHDIAIIIDTYPQNMTGIVNDTTYEYRSRMSVILKFTHITVGGAAVLSESSIRYPTGEIDKETNEPIYTDEKPVDNFSTSGNCDCIKDELEPIIVPEYKPSASGGGSRDLADKDVGYFIEAEIKEDKHNE